MKYQIVNRSLIMEIRIRTLTPIWTGDVDQRSESLQCTGIMGSLRWWVETTLRSMNRFVCDPSGENRCPPKDSKSYCVGCLIFGATGIRRSFRLNISGGETVFVGDSINIKPSGRKRGWYLGSGIVEDRKNNSEINFKITPLNSDFDEILVLLPLIIASKWGGIGAKIQHGYGVVEIEDLSKIEFNRFKEAVEKIISQKRLIKLSVDGLRAGNNQNLPNLKDMFFAKVQFETANADWWTDVDGIKQAKNKEILTSWINSGSVPVSPAIKSWLRSGEGRRLWSVDNKNQGERIENWLFGITKKFERIASKINISCAYPVKNNLYEFRIWGWIPKNGLPAGFNRDDFLDNLKQALDNDSRSTKVPWNKLLGNQTRNHELTVWREYNASRDTVKPNESDIDNYFQSFLECK